VYRQTDAWDNIRQAQPIKKEIDLPSALNPNQSNLSLFAFELSKELRIYLQLVQRD